MARTFDQLVDQVMDTIQHHKRALRVVVYQGRVAVIERMPNGALAVTTRWSTTNPNWFSEGDGMFGLEGDDKA